MSREVSLAIGVASASTLPYLGGAINGARTFHEWASTLGYESRLLTDDSGEVTLPRLRQELESLLQPPKMPIHRFVLYFAGHGLIREAEEGLWLLSDWYREQRAIAIEVLKRRLFAHDIQQIAIFADCCRSLPTNMLTADLTADGVLGLGPLRPPKMPAIDKFTAAQDGAAAFMVPGLNPDEDRCLFSGVLMEGLWGMKPEAFSRLLNDKVTSRSLAAFLQDEVPQRAKLYKQSLQPTVSPTFPEDDDIYFYSGPGGPPARPVFAAWPSPTAIAEAEEKEEEVATVEATDFASFISSTDTPLVARIRLQERPIAFETGAGFAVEGGSVKAIWTTRNVRAESVQSNWWRLNTTAQPRLVRSAPVLIEFEDELFAAVVALPEFIATIIREDRGVSALIYRRVHEPRETAAAAEWAIGMMERGALRADAVTDMATELRKEKHSDPVLGVLSAYLYDSIGDIDSIRRMAYYYADNGQPIPYDIALLAQLLCKRENGFLEAKVPPVARREPRTEAERLNDWTYSATFPRDGEVGGLWPWMRQGWPFIDDVAGDESALIKPGLSELRRHLTTGRFTTLARDGATELATMFNLTRRA
jgi:hypothetical protein